MLDNLLMHPKELTPSMEKYKKRFYEKSNKRNNKNVLLDKEIEKFHIIEWDNGWAQFSLTDNTLYVRTMYSDADGEFKFQYLYELAKNLNKKEIVFDTERNPKAWIKLLESRNYKAKLKSYTIGVKI